MNYNRRMLAVLALIVILIVAAACEPTPLGTVTPPPAGDPLSCAQEPRPNYWQRSEAGLVPCEVEPVYPDAAGRLAVGDSLTVQPIMAGWTPQVPTYAHGGWSAREVLPWLRQLNTEGHRPTHLVVALGTNDANPGYEGWNATDVDRWTELLGLADHVTVVLPAIGAQGDPAHRAQVDVARQWVMAQGVDAVDWQWAADNPTITGADGIHAAMVGPNWWEFAPGFAPARGGILDHAASGTVAQAARGCIAVDMVGKAGVSATAC